MEALIFFIFPLFIFIGLKIAIWRDVDYTAIDLKKYDEGLRMINFGFYNEAVNYFNEEIKKQPKSMVCYAMRGKAHLFLHNYYQAIYNFDKALSLNHDLHEIFLYKGMALYKIDDFELALKEFNKAAWYYKDKNIEVFKWRAKVYIALGNTEAAQKDLSKSKQINTQIKTS